MKRTRRKVEKLALPVSQTFDQQFWPVLIALTVLSGIAAGAILSLLSGVWMWGALLALPAATAAIVYALYRMDDTRFRRSLQLSILVSLGFHLLLLVVASFISIFQNPYQTPQREIAQRQQKTIVISKKQQPFVWEMTQKHAVANPNVEAQRQQSQSSAQAQSVPVERSQLTPTPQTVRRERTNTTIPRLDRELSQLRRSTSNVEPRSSVPAAMAAKNVASKSEPAQANRQAARSAESAADEMQRQQSESMASRSVTKLKEIRQASPASSRSERQATEIAAAPAPASESIATRKRRTPRIPTVASSEVAEAKPAAPAKAQVREAEPTAVTIARRSSAASAEKVVAKTETKTQRSTVRKSERQESLVTQQTLARPDVDTPQPRKTTRQANVASTVAQLDAPANPTSAKTIQSRRPSPQALAVSKSESGTAGAGRAENLESDTGGLTSPALVASDSSRNEKRENTLAKNISLSSQQQAENGRSTARSLQPKSSFKAETADIAKIAGSSQPSLKSESSSAANIDSATRDDRSKTIAEKGQSQLDLGPTKVVKDSVEKRRGGGGMPEITPAAPSELASGRRLSEKTPTQIAAAALDTQGPLTPSSMPAVSGANVNNDADNVARSSSDANERITKAPNQDSDLEFQSRLTNAYTERFADKSGAIQALEPVKEPNEDAHLGNARTRLASAPSPSATASLGLEDPIDGPAESETRRPTAGNSIASDIVNRASNSIPGSVLARSAAGALAQAASSMPLADTSGMGRRRNKETASLGTSRSESESTNRGRSNQKQPNAPIAEGVARIKPSENANGAGASTELLPDAMGDSESIVRSDTRKAGTKLDIRAELGAAGLADDPSRTIGVTTRPATKQSRLIAVDSDARFKKREFGGMPTVSPQAVMAREAFRDRRPSAKSKSAPSTEAAVESGLEFLARFQAPDGSWSLGRFDVDHPNHQSQLTSDTAATGLAMLAFQGAGYNHREFKYKAQLQKAVDWMVKNQSKDGGLYLEADDKSNSSSRMYSHAIAALAITEAYGMTQDPKLREPAQRSIAYIEATQDPDKGGWRYFPTGKLRSTDTSVTGWMMMALQSARLAGLRVEDGTFRAIDSWLDMAAIFDSEYAYNPFGTDAAGISREQGRRASYSMTAVGLLMRVYSGWDRSDLRFQRGALKLLEQMPSDLNPKLRDTYYWYYATQVLKHAGGDAWETWNRELQPLLVGSQEKRGDMRGSWHPYEPVPDRWGAHGGRLYVTAMNLLSLEVRYRLLPLYDQTINK